MGKVKTEVTSKLIHLKDYTKTNVKSLKLAMYKDKITSQFKEERVYLKNKIEE